VAVADTDTTDTETDALVQKLSTLVNDVQAAYAGNFIGFWTDVNPVLFTRLSDEEALEKLQIFIKRPSRPMTEELCDLTVCCVLKTIVGYTFYVVPKDVEDKTAWTFTFTVGALKQLLYRDHGYRKSLPMFLYDMSPSCTEHVSRLFGIAGDIQRFELIGKGQDSDYIVWGKLMLVLKTPSPPTARTGPSRPCVRHVPLKNQRNCEVECEDEYVSIDSKLSMTELFPGLGENTRILVTLTIRDREMFTIRPDQFHWSFDDFEEFSLEDVERLRIVWIQESQSPATSSADSHTAVVE
jgi:hypothetical protein